MSLTGRSSRTINNNNNNNNYKPTEINGSINTELAAATNIDHRHCNGDIPKGEINESSRDGSLHALDGKAMQFLLSSLEENLREENRTLEEKKEGSNHIYTPDNENSLSGNIDEWEVAIRLAFKLIVAMRRRLQAHSSRVA
eukprot:GHVU01051375.1.p1 GENE.GHVU01051375.1~~GHVU01051375.1.p1  ORF type:complete len:141 (+),score=24.89 GHVU01051375.1:887-1309(+)